MSTKPPAGSAAEAAGIRSDLTRLARDSGIMLVGAVVSAVGGFLLVVVVTRRLGPTRAGVFLEAVALFSIISVVAELGADDGLLRMLPRSLALGRARDVPRLLAVALGPILLIGPLFGLSLFVLAPQVANAFARGPREAAALVSPIRVLAPFVTLAALSVVLLAASRGFGSVMPYVLVDNVGKPLVRPLVAWVVLVAGLGPTAVSIAWAAPIAAGLAVAAIAVARRLRDTRAAAEGPVRPASQIGGEFWRFALPRGIAGALAIGLTWIDTLLVGGLRGVREAGIYAAATRYLVVGMVAIQAIQLAVAPMLSTLFSRHELQRARMVYRTATQWLVLGAWPLYLTMALFGPVLLRAFGAEFGAGQGVLTALSLAALAVTGAGPSQMVLLMAGKSGWTLANTAASLVLNVVLNLLLIPRMGIEGAALAWVVSLVFNNVVSVVELRTLVGVSPFGRGLAVVAGSALACFGAVGLAVRLAMGPTVLGLLVALAVGAAAHLAILWRARSLLNLRVVRDVIRARGRRPGPLVAADPQP
jgi:O-antigen/teichoic acid export membrane protein